MNWAGARSMVMAVAGQRSAHHRVGRKKFSDRKPGQPQKMPRSARAIVVANNFDSHGFSGEASACLF